MAIRAGKIPVILGVLWLVALPVSARDLTFEERVDAQRAIEKVYWAHQIGATRPFDEAVPRSVLEKKVQAYLRQSLALEKFWHTPVSAEMLRRESERIAGSTRMADRLKELYTALGNDPFLFQETVARPVLVDRMARSFFSTDQTIHSASRSQIEGFHRRLSEGSLDPFSRSAGGIVTELLLDPEVGAEVARAGSRADPTGAHPLKVSAERFQEA